MNACVWNLETQDRGAYLQGRNRVTDEEDGHVSTEGKERLKPMGTVVLTCAPVTRLASGKLLHSPGGTTQPWGDGVSRRRGHVYGVGWRFSCQVVFDSYDPMDCSLPGSSVHGISQARTLEWAAVSSSRVPS